MKKLIILMTLCSTAYCVDYNEFAKKREPLGNQKTLISNDENLIFAVKDAASIGNKDLLNQHIAGCNERIKPAAVYSALDAAAKEGHKDIIFTLLNEPSLHSLSDEMYNNLLLTLAKKTSLPLLRELLAFGEEKEILSKEMIDKAAVLSWRHIPCLEYFLNLEQQGLPSVSQSTKDFIFSQVMENAPSESMQCKVNNKMEYRRPFNQKVELLLNAGITSSEIQKAFSKCTCIGVLQSLLEPRNGIVLIDLETIRALDAGTKEKIRTNQNSIFKSAPSFQPTNDVLEALMS
ncbi:MAG: hypothetical protein Q8S21_04385 [Candidatus Paracaedibacteraceae bacterium]|nr:hypothetical protein [Candidatus Paracaedibacteraceae bacterium]